METADISTEEKIIDAARRIFTQKGFLATTVRDIAAEADINTTITSAVRKNCLRSSWTKR